MAARYIYNLLKIFCFYLLLFALCRETFLLYFAAQVMPNGPGIFLISLYKAIPLDISTASYLTFLPLIALTLAQFCFPNFCMRVLRGYLFVTAFICAFLAMAEIGVYREVHVKLYFNLLTHLQHVSELALSISITLLVTVLVLISGLSFLIYWIVRKWFADEATAGKMTITTGLKIFIAFATAGTLLVIGCRGGLQPIPINEGEVYFSNNQCVNDATVNPLWSIVHSYIENRHVLSGNAYQAMPDEEANEIVKHLYNVEKDTTLHLFKVARPNICILILESWSADIISSLGGYAGLTPNFEKLVQQGYLFTNIKPAGHVSDQGVPAILSGYPALPIGSAINQPERQVNLPNINNEFFPAGYYSTFLFGGQLIYGNIKTYIYRNRFDRVTEQDDLPATLPAGRLGIHDSLMLNIWHDSLNSYKTPFLSVYFTLSTHSPYDAPTNNNIHWGGNHEPYLNSVAYADRQIGRFMDEAKKEKWYDSTVFILVADHSHGTPKEYSYETSAFYHIPLLICGGALKEEFRGVKNERLGSQTDIACTLLKQLGYPTTAYRWSKNLLNPYTQPFAFYTFDEGFGFADSTNTVIWNKRFPSQNSNTAKTEEDRNLLMKKGAAILQVLMNDFLSK